MDDATTPGGARTSKARNIETSIDVEVSLMVGYERRMALPRECNTCKAERSLRQGERV
jgi:hypothetical protein